MNDYSKSITYIILTASFILSIICIFAIRDTNNRINNFENSFIYLVEDVCSLKNEVYKLRKDNEFK